MDAAAQKPLEALSNNFTDPKLEYFDGSYPRKVHFRVRRDLEMYNISSTDDSRLPLLKVSKEANGPSRNAAEMKLQL
jgi:hypothetical protein